jgi:hypothetical protein
VENNNKGIIPHRTQLMWLVKDCPTGYARCELCHLWVNNDCKYPAFQQGATCQPRKDFGTTGISIETERK